MAEQHALGIIHLSTAFQPVLDLAKALHWMGQAEQQESCEEPVFSPDSGVSLCILKGRCCFICIFPLYNKRYLSDLMYLSVF